ncbi:hypothetical protein PAXINDRAFT_15533 [Paxillus involutus ATCC 200175]|uniref:Uncharacterized protein n=1 Tax=Paxillus involutus ATCC 200175 TaxID=664439 RepID=A0A0C9SSY9_PAXIN|nr:hypothetical protein PAXINDRAFT_15533 [Paxillus involutus ATCC 200175]
MLVLQLTCQAGKLPNPQPNNAEATPPAWSNSLEKSQHPSECSKHLEDEVEDPPPCSKVNSRHPPTTYVEHVKQLVLLGDATSTNGRATASPRSCSSSLEWPGSDIDFTQIEEHEDPYEVEPETKAFNEDISDDESDTYKPDNDNKDCHDP